MIMNRATSLSPSIHRSFYFSQETPGAMLLPESALPE